jgi:hypothetical protein
MTTIKITAKCSDMFSVQLFKDTKMVGEYDGYVPEWMPGEHYGDYVELEIDIHTGKIVNWKQPSVSALKETFSVEKI